MTSLTKLLNLGCIATCVALGSVMITGRSATAQSVNFFCGSDGSSPVTYASTARGNVPIVRWRSHYFSGAGYTPQQRCSEVSGRFQTYYNNNTLNYITTGIMNRQPVVCVSPSQGGGCAGLLFTLRPSDNASQVVQQLFDIRAGAAGPINQSANRPYINVSELLNTRPVEGGATATSPTAPASVSPSTPANPTSAPSSGGGSVW